MAKNDDTTAAKGAATAGSDSTQAETTAKAPAAAVTTSATSPEVAAAAAPEAVASAASTASASSASSAPSATSQQNSKHVPVAIEVIARVDGFWRGERQWTTQPQTVPLSELSERQLREIENEPLLITRAVYGER